MTSVLPRQKTSCRVAGSYLLVLPALIGSCLLGCGKSSQGTVSGKITFQGDPVTQGDITFSGPVDVAQGKVNEEGAYELWMMGDGLAPGEYRVTVTPLRTFVEIEGRDPKLVLVGGEKIPKVYRNKRTTKLKATVTGGDDTINFELQP